MNCAPRGDRPGRPTHPEVRKLALLKTRFDIYYVYDPNAETVEIRSIWNSQRGHGPRL